MGWEQILRAKTTKMIISIEKVRKVRRWDKFPSEICRKGVVGVCWSNKIGGGGAVCSALARIRNGWNKIRDSSSLLTKIGLPCLNV